MKRVPSWVFGLAVILVPSLVFLVAAPLLRARSAAPARPEDRAHVVTAAELPGGLPVDPAREVLERSAETDGSVRLTYRYPREVLPGEPVSVECIVVRAIEGSTATRALGLVTDEVKKSLAPRADLLAWGDEVRAGDVLKEGRVVGTYLAARQGRHVFILRVTGLTLDAGAIDRVVRPKLEQLTGFDAT